MKTDKVSVQNLILLAFIFLLLNILGLRPILNASVYLDVEIDTENGTGLAILPLQMLDDGHGGKISKTQRFLHNLQNSNISCIWMS